MKSFTDYFTNNQKRYEFTVRLANCDFNNDMKKNMERGLSAYVVETIGAAKRLPITEHSEFPGLGACDVHMFQVAVKYPVVSDQIRQTVAESLKISARQVFVRSIGEEANFAKSAEPKKAADGSVLNNPELEAESGQAMVGNSRIESMLKELQTRRYEIAGKAEKGN